MLCKACKPITKPKKVSDSLTSHFHRIHTSITKNQNQDIPVKGGGVLLQGMATNTYPIKSKYPPHKGKHCIYRFQMPYHGTAKRNRNQSLNNVLYKISQALVSKPEKKSLKSKITQSSSTIDVPLQSENYKFTLYQ